MGLEIGGLSKSLVTAVKRTHVRPVSGVDTDVGPEVEVEREPLTTTFKCTLKERKDTMSLYVHVD